MKARQDFEVFVTDGTIYPHYEGDSIGKKIRITIKKGKEVPQEILSYLIQHNPDWLEIDENEKGEILQKKSALRKAPIIKPKPKKKKGK